MMFVVDFFISKQICQFFAQIFALLALIDCFHNDPRMTGIRTIYLHQLVIVFIYPTKNYSSLLTLWRYLKIHFQFTEAGILGMGTAMRTYPLCIAKSRSHQTRFKPSWRLTDYFFSFLIFYNDLPIIACARFQ